jgi:hypothetical protein
MEDFCKHVIRNLGPHARFPMLPDAFNSAMTGYLQNGLTGLSPSRDFLWVRGGKVKACYALFSVDFNKNAAVKPAVALKNLWDIHLMTWNDEASRYARGAWHSSSLWVRAEAARELYKSTVLTLAVVIGVCFLGMMVFTFDVVLSFFVVLATLSVLTMLFFFIVTMMGWAVGPIEVIALIVFLGYAVTYSLHVTHKYGAADALKVPGPEHLKESHRIRYQRTQYALRTIGGATIGSACTTIGCAVFLVFCTLTIFQKLGGVVLAVTIMSIFTALIPLPSALLIAGPVSPGIQQCWACYEYIRSQRWRQGELPRISTIWRRKSKEPQLTDLAVVTAPPHAHMQPSAMQQSGIVPMMPPPVGSVRQPQATRPALRIPQVDADGTRSSQQGFDIGEESPLEPIWARQTDNRARGAGTGVVLGPRSQKPATASRSLPNSPAARVPKENFVPYDPRGRAPAVHM